MSRLYYAPTKALATAANAAGPKVAPAPAQAFNINEVAQKVAKLVPAELITAYTALIGFAANAGATARPWCDGIAFVICLALTPIYLDKLADAGKPKVLHLIVSSLAFVV
jgi:hypothetical protein